jgi:hypothetical protein
MTEFKQYTGTVASIGNVVKSKYGGYRMKIVVRFENGFETEVWGGGADHIQRQELEALKALNAGEPVVLVEKFSKTGEAKYYLDPSMYEHIQVPEIVTGPAGPGVAGPAGPGPTSPPPYATGPAAAPPQPQQPVVERSSQPSPNKPNLAPLDNDRLLQAAVGMEECQQLWLLALKMAKHTLDQTGLFGGDDGFALELASRFFSEQTPYRLRLDLFDVGEFVHPVHGPLRTPLSADKLVASLRAKSAKDKDVDFGDNLKAVKTMAVMGLNKLFRDDAGRKAFLKLVFEQDSLTKISNGQLSAIVSWMGTSREINYELSPVVWVEASLLERLL